MAILTAEQVYDMAGISVNVELISKAQLVIVTASGVDLADPDDFGARSLRDQRRLTTAVVWQCVYLNQHPEAFAGGEQPANVVQASANGASVTFLAGADASLAPLAARELDGLSWRVGPVQATTLRAYTAADRRPPQPDPWVPLL